MSSKVTKLLDLGSNDTVAAVNWHEKGNILAIGTNLGIVELWDANKSKKVN